MKQNITFLLIILMSMVGAKASAYDIAVKNEDGVTIYYNYINDGTELEVVTKYDLSNSNAIWGGYNGVTNLKIPEEVTFMNRDRKVTSIAPCTFQPTNYNKISLASIYIPKTINHIGYAAFEDCETLEKVYIEDVGAWCEINFELGSSNPLRYAKHIFRYDNTEIKELVIPDGTSKISCGAFYNCLSFVSVKIANSVKSVEESAFYGAENINRVDVGDGVNTIGASAFYGCKNLNTVSFGDGIKSIGGYAFRGSNSLDKIIVKDIEVWCGIDFNPEQYGTPFLTNTQPDKYIHLYSNDTHVISDLIIPESVSTIKKYAFHGFAGIKSIVIPDKVISIESDAFSYCPDLENVQIGDGVTKIGWNVFGGCSKLSDVKFGKNVTIIGYEAFCNCGFSFLNLPEGIKEIDDRSFVNCSNLTALTIPSTVTEIGVDAFGGADIYSIISLIEEPFPIATHYSYISGTYYPFSNNTLKNTTLYVPEGTLDKYKNAEGWKDFVFIEEFDSNVIKTTGISLNQTTLSFDAVNQTATLTATITPSNATNKNVTWTSSNTSVATVSNAGVVTSKGNGTAIITAKTTDGTNLTATCTVTINILGDMVEVDDIYYALDVNNKTAEVISNPNGYSGIINIPNIIVYNNQTYRVTSIGKNAFDGCTSLTSIAIPSSLKRVKTGAFSGCTSLGKVIIQDIAAWCGIIYDGTDSNGDFPLGRAQHLYSDNNTEITEVVIPAGVKRIEPLAFRDAKFITSVTIPNSVTYIGREAFRGMHRLTSVNLPQGITSIEPYLLQDCEALITINIPEGVTSIGEHTFRKCYALTRINIPSSVTTIGSYAFRYCNSLTDVYCYAENVPETNTNAFDNSPIAYATLHVPQGSVSAYKNTSPWSGFGGIVVIGEEAPIEAMEIASANGLIEFANRVNAGETSLCAKLTKDINLSSVNNRLVPIGREDSPYRGTFDGQKHKITGLKMNIDGNRQGLFGSIMNAQIKNFSIDGSITYYGGTGVGVIGWSEGSTIHNVHSSLNITINSDDSHHIGGICGSMRTGTKAIGCSYSGKITDTANTIDCIGGIGGYSNEYCLYENCANYGTISFTASSANVGGICGYVNNNNFIGVRNCLNVGTLRLNSGTPDFGGAIIGHLRKHGNSVFENNYMLNGSAVRAGGENDINNVNKVNAQQLASGEICYKLNGNQTLTYWYQNLFADEDHTPDPYPVLDPTHEMVLYNDAKGYYNANDPDGIRILSSDSYEGICYDLQGRMLSKPQKGINIIRYSDGTSKKVLVK